MWPFYLTIHISIIGFFAKSYVFYKWPTTNPTPKPTHPWSLDKLY